MKEQSQRGVPVQASSFREDPLVLARASGEERARVGHDRGDRDSVARECVESDSTGRDSTARDSTAVDSNTSDGIASDRVILELSNASAEQKEQALKAWLSARAPILVGYSGGVDSAYLAVVALEAVGEERTLAVIGRSPSYPEAQWVTAREVAREFRVPLLEVDTNEMNDPRYAANPTNRCYFCKSVLWDTLIPIAAARGFATIVDGTNADDLGDHRPGKAAAGERRVESPLADCGLTKREIRFLSQRRGLPTWSQPSSPCLSSRLPYGTGVTPERLRAVEVAESALRALGVSGDLRVRHHGDLARVELSADELQRWLEPKYSARLAQVVRDAGFARVAIDLRGFRSGSLNVLSGVTSA
jgi:pyridinium-3,5-biscarboxylic acid mononucleotide sulfurtransferase